MLHSRMLMYLKGFDEASDAVLHVANLEMHLFKDEGIEIVLTFFVALAETIIREMREREHIDYVQ